MFLFDSGKSLNTRLLILFMVIGLLPLVVAVILFVQYSRQVDIEQASRELNGITRGLSNEVQSYLNEVKIDAQAIANLPDIRSMDPEAQQIVLQTFAETYDRYDVLAIVGLDGQILMTSRGSPADLTINHIPSFQAALAGRQSAVVAPHLTDPDQLILHMHTPIFNEAGQTIAVLGSPVILDNISPLLSGALITGMSDIFILGEDRTVLIPSDVDGLGGGQQKGADFADLFLMPVEYTLSSNQNLTDRSDLSENDPPPSDSHATIYEVNGVTYLVSYKTLADIGWTVVISRPLDEVLTTADLGSALIAWSLALTFLAGVALAAYLARRISAPIIDLAAAANALQVGDSSRPLPAVENQVNEIQTLVEAFDAMRTAVSDRERELRELSQTLEERVSVRTEELARINRRLHDEIYKHTVLEKELIVARDQAEAANLAKGVFLATMSHELRTPLTAIIGYSEILLEDEVFTSHQSSEDIDSILRSARHLLTIINGVLDLAKIESERMEVDLAPLNLRSIIEDACIFVLPLLEGNGNNFRATIHPLLDQPVISDELKIRQILTNLLSNAAKFTEKGEIHLDSRLIIDPETDRHILQLKVTDTGIGIRGDQIEELFEPFVQLDSARNRKYPGTGLGLTLTQRLCQIMDGDVTVDSIYEKGTTFTVTLPVQLESIKI